MTTDTLYRARRAVTAAEQLAAAGQHAAAAERMDQARDLQRQLDAECRQARIPDHIAGPLRLLALRPMLLADHRPRRPTAAAVRAAMVRRIARGHQLIAEWEARPQGSRCLEMVRKQIRRLEAQLAARDGYAVDPHAKTRRMRAVR